MTVSLFALFVTGFVLAAKYPDVFCLLDNSGPINDISTLQQQLNHESTMRAELEKQITSLQTIALSLQAEMRIVKVNCENEKQNLSAWIINVQNNLTRQIDHCENRQQNLSTRMTNVEALQKNSSLKLQDIDNAISTFAKKQPLVAFLAKLMHNIINAPTARTIVYENVVTNIGHAYDKSTDIFTAPVAVIYEFSFSISSSVGLIQGFLLKNGERLLGIYTEPGQTSWGLGSATISLYLNKGDNIYVREVDHGIQTVHSGDMTYFTGHLVQQV